MQIFGEPAQVRSIRRREGGVEIRAEISRHPRGWRVTGTLRGRPGRIEVFRAPAPRRFLLNNWQSWGPCVPVEDRGPAADAVARYESYTRWVFTPLPDAFAAAAVSDYFVGWEGAVAGFLSSRAAHPYFTFEGGDLVGRLDYFGAEAGDGIRLEPFVVLSGAPLEALLEEYADLAAADARPVVPARNPVGWSSWYQYFTELSGADLDKNLRLARAGFPFEVFQVDDGYEADIGDWLTAKPGFPGPADLARRIREAGFTAGIWTAPFSASETSELFGRHPDWFVAEAGRPKPCYRGWKKTIYALDTTHPDAQAWLFETIAALRKMGYDYFKIDFLFAAAMPGERRGAGTPIQAYRQGLSILRQAAADGFVLACGAPLLPSLGACDGMRVGEDTAPFWDPRRSGWQGPNAYVALKNPILRWFMHRRWWLNDPDCLLLRDRDIEMGDGERALYARAAGLLDAMLIDSDDLELIGERGRALLAESVSLQGGRPRVRGVLDDDAYVIESTGGPAGDRRYAVNLSETPKTIEGLLVAPRSGEFLP